MLLLFYISKYMNKNLINKRKVKLFLFDGENCVEAHAEIYDKSPAFV